MYELINLPYKFDDLKPFLTKEQVEIHHTLYQKEYVITLNEIIAKENLPIYPLEEIPKNIEKYPIKDRGNILYNAGAILNHNLYWYSLNPIQNLPKGKLLNKINNQYGSFDNFKQEFTNRAQNLVGSGYIFLVTNQKGDLTILNLVNEETPLSYNLIPLFTIDLWEHAYYHDYKNDKNKYINNFWNKANFNYATKTYEEIVR